MLGEHYGVSKTGEKFLNWSDWSDIGPMLEISESEGGD